MALRRHLLVPPPRRRHAKLTLEGPVESRFRVIADSGGHLADGLLPLHQKFLGQQRAHRGPSPRQRSCQDAGNVAAAADQVSARDIAAQTLKLFKDVSGWFAHGNWWM